MEFTDERAMYSSTARLLQRIQELQELLRQAEAGVEEIWDTVQYAASVNYEEAMYWQEMYERVKEECEAW
jgi:hypothetical protein